MSANKINDLGGAVFSADGRKLLAFSSQGLDTTAWVSYDLATGKARNHRRREARGHEARAGGTVHVRSAGLHAPFHDREWVVLDPRCSRISTPAIAMDGRVRSKAARATTAPGSSASCGPTSRCAISCTTATAQDDGARRVHAAAGRPEDVRHVSFVTKSSDGFDLVSYIAYPSWVKLDANGIPPAPQPL